MGAPFFFFQSSEGLNQSVIDVGLSFIVAITTLNMPQASNPFRGWQPLTAF